MDPIITWLNNLDSFPDCACAVDFRGEGAKAATGTVTGAKKRTLLQRGTQPATLSVGLSAISPRLCLALATAVTAVLVGGERTRQTNNKVLSSTPKSRGGTKKEQPLKTVRSSGAILNCQLLSTSKRAPKTRKVSQQGFKFQSWLPKQVSGLFSTFIVMLVALIRVFILPVSLFAIVLT